METEDLVARVKAAIREGSKIAERVTKEREEAQRQGMLKTAMNHFDQLPSSVAEARLKGQPVIIMLVQPEEFKIESKDKPLEPTLSGVAKLVHEVCEKAGLKVYFVPLQSSSELRMVADLPSTPL